MVIWGKELKDLTKTLLYKVTISGKNGSNITKEAIKNDIVAFGRPRLLNRIGAKIMPWSFENIARA
jgi:hypothetical protein